MAKHVHGSWSDLTNDGRDPLPRSRALPTSSEPTKGAPAGVQLRPRSLTNRGPFRSAGGERQRQRITTWPRRRRAISSLAPLAISSACLGDLPRYYDSAHEGHLHQESILVRAGLGRDSSLHAVARIRPVEAHRADRRLYRLGDLAGRLLLAGKPPRPRCRAAMDRGAGAQGLAPAASAADVAPKPPTAARAISGLGESIRKPQRDRPLGPSDRRAVIRRWRLPREYERQWPVRVPPPGPVHFAGAKPVPGPAQPGEIILRPEGYGVVIEREAND